MVLMIIKGLCKRYERWNPVHPTSGAFWGMGLGIGCGVGWGPGFGPEVIGYVGAGCGIGFSVGITLAGVGIGLPANIILRAPYSALVAIRGRMFDRMLSNDPLPTYTLSEDHWNNCSPPSILGLQKAVTQKGMARMDIVELRNAIASNIKSTLEGVRTFHSQFLGPREGTEN